MNAPRRPRAVLPLTLEEALSGALAPTELAYQQRERMRETILHQAREATPEGTVTLRAAEAEWVDCAPFIRMRVLKRDRATGYQSVLLRVQPGGVMPPHRHTYDEELIVLEGECHVGTHRLTAGDVHLAAAGSWHPAITTRTGVVVLLRGGVKE